MARRPIAFPNVFFSSLHGINTSLDDGYLLLSFGAIVLLKDATRNENSCAVDRETVLAR